MHTAPYRRPAARSTDWEPDYREPFPVIQGLRRTGSLARKVIPLREPQRESQHSPRLCSSQRISRSSRIPIDVGGLTGRSDLLYALHNEVAVRSRAGPKAASIPAP